MKKNLLAVFLFAAAYAGAATVFTENFNNVGALTGAGWVIVNNSSPVGINDWFQGNPGVFTSQAGANNAYAATNYLAGGGSAQLSAWLITPLMTIADGDVFSFFTRVANQGLADSLEVRFSVNGGANPGSTPTSVNDFNHLLLTVNPGASANGYPDAWTNYNAAVSGVGSVSGRYAFRYVVGNNDVAGDYIGIDTLNISNSGATVPEPGAFFLVAGGLALAAVWKRRSLNI